MKPEQLFAKGKLSTYFDEKRQLAIKTLENLGDKEFLNSNKEELIEKYKKLFNIRILHFNPSEKYIKKSKQEEPTDSVINLYVPYKGESNLFMYRPDNFIKPEIPITGDIISDIIIFSYDQPDFNAQTLKNKIENEMEFISKTVNHNNEQVEEFNKTLIKECSTLITAKLEMATKKQTFIQNLEIPYK